MSTIGERLRNWRKERNLTTKQISEEAKISQGGYSDCENDKVLIGSKVLISLYRTYNIDINYILTGEEKELLTENEKELLLNFEKLPEREQIKFIGKLEDTVEKYKHIDNKNDLSSTSKIG